VATIFSRIIDGELPGRFVWRDEHCVAFLSINPITPGHTLVVPRVEVDHWLDLDEDLWLHCQTVARIIGSAIQKAFDPPRVGQMVEGFLIPHVHVHVLQIDTGDLALVNSSSDPDPDEMDRAAAAIRTALTELGHEPAAA
jgi:diadenosine tetraphosphate (Ap4A) HIT family hydrolase